MLVPFKRNTTSVSVYNIAERTGLAVADLVTILDRSDFTLSLDDDYLSPKELKFLAKQYVNAVKHLQKKTYAKKDRMAPSKLQSIRKFLASFVGLDFFSPFENEHDSLKASLNDERIEKYFYRLIYGEVQTLGGTGENIKLRLKHDASGSCRQSKYIPGLVFRSRQFYIYPDEDEDKFYIDQWSFPLAA